MDESDPAHSSGGVAAEIGDEEMVGFDAQVGARKCVARIRLTDDVVLNNHRFLLIVAYGKRGLVKLPFTALLFSHVGSPGSERTEEQTTFRAVR